MRGLYAECYHCGRRYDDLTPAEQEQMDVNGPCPSDDCPGRDGTNGQDRDSYTDTQDRDSYTREG